MATVFNPQVINAWERSPRQLHMAEVEEFEIVGKGNYYFFYIIVSRAFSVAHAVGKENLSEVFRVAEVNPVLRRDYRVFTRGDKLIFGNRNSRSNRSGPVVKHNTMAIVPQRTERILGPGAPVVYLQ